MGAMTASQRERNNAYRREWRRQRDAKLAEDCDDGRLSDDPLAALLKQVDPNGARLKKFQTIREMLIEGELSVREIAIKTGVQAPMIAKIRSMIPGQRKCGCGRPANHTGKCAVRQERSTILNTPGMAMTAFAAGRCDRFLSRHAELSDAIKFFEHAKDNYPEVKEPLGKFYRLGSITPREIGVIVDAFRIARQRGAEMAQGIISNHVGVIGQRILRLRVKMISMVQTKRPNKRFRAFLKKKAVDEIGNVVTWIEQSKEETPDGWFFMDCTVREQVFFEGQKQTVLERCKVRPEVEEEGPAKEILGNLAAKPDLTPEEHDSLEMAGTAIGDEAAFTAFAKRYRKRLVGVATRLVGPFDAEDVAQLALLEIWAIASRFRFRCEVKAWVLTIAKRLAIRHLHAAQRMRSVSLEERMAEHHWEPISRDMPPWGGLFIEELGSN